MKKILAVSALLFIGLAMFAQSRGENYLGVSLGTSFGTQKSRLFDGINTTTSVEPSATSASLNVEGGFFVVDNLRLSLATGVSFNSTPSSATSSLNTNTLGVQINPSIAYYVKLADRLYYTPEVGGAFEIGVYWEKLTSNTSYTTRYMGWSVYAHLLALEYRVSQKFAIGIGLGSVSYTYAKVKDGSSDVFIDTGQFLFNLNSATASAKFYF